MNDLRGRLGERGNEAETHFAMLRCGKISPGFDFVITDSGTRESAQPFQSTCPSERRHQSVCLDE